MCALCALCARRALWAGAAAARGARGRRGAQDRRRARAAAAAGCAAPSPHSPQRGALVYPVDYRELRSRTHASTHPRASARARTHARKQICPTQMWPIDAPCLVYTRLLQISGELSEIRDTFHGLSTTQVDSALAANGTGPPRDLRVQLCVVSRPHSRHSPSVVNRRAHTPSSCRRHCSSSARLRSAPRARAAWGRLRALLSRALPLQRAMRCTLE
jgi:hypothetical protein